MFSPPNLKEEIIDVLAPVSIISVFTVLWYWKHRGRADEGEGGGLGPCGRAGARE